MDFPRGLVRAELVSDYPNAMQMRICQTGEVIGILCVYFGCDLNGSSFVRDAQRSSCKRDGLSNSIRQIFNGRRQSDPHCVACARETRFDSRPKGVLTTETKRQNAQSNELVYQARQRYFASPAPLFSPFFSGKTEKNGPPEASRIDWCRKNGLSAQPK